MNRAQPLSCGVLAVIAILFSAHAHGQTAGWRPDRAVEFIVPAAAGGLNDLTMRNMQRVMQALKLVEVPITVNNKGGAGGTLAFVALSQHPGDAHYLSISTVNMLANHIVGASTLNYTDFTALGHLIHSYLGFAVMPDSPITSGRDLQDRLKKDPSSLSIAVGTSLGNTSHIAISQVAKAAGVDPRKLKTVVFKSNGEAVTAFFGGHVDVIVAGLPNLAKHAQASKLRPIAVTSPERLGGVLSTVPTWREQGTNVVVSGWRGALGPARLQPGQVAYWEAVVARLVDSDEWQQELAKDFATRTRMNAAENREFLAKEYKSYHAILSDLGMAKK